MSEEYAEWITENVKDCLGMCSTWTAKLMYEFPELTRVRGHYLCWGWGEREHWWCVAPDGSIVDPTAAQFPSKGHGEYVPLPENAPEPTGMCPDCGEYVYDGNTFCSTACERNTIAYLNSAGAARRP